MEHLSAHTKQTRCGVRMQLSTGFRKRFLRVHVFVFGFVVALVWLKCECVFVEGGGGSVRTCSDLRPLKHSLVAGGDLV